MCPPERTIAVHTWIEALTKAGLEWKAARNVISTLPVEVLQLPLQYQASDLKEFAVAAPTVPGYELDTGSWTGAVDHDKAFAQLLSLIGFGLFGLFNA